MARSLRLAHAGRDTSRPARDGGARRTIRAVTDQPWTGRRVHVLGIGGAGMSAYALAAQALGATVTGSDRAASPYLERVRAAGIAAVVGHDARERAGGDGVEVVASTAVPADNPEVVAARARGLLESARARTSSPS